jgi:protein SCO1/2
MNMNAAPASNDQPMGLSRRRLLAALGSAPLLAGTRWARAEDHSHHAAPAQLRRSVVEYSLPSVNLLRQDGTRQSLRQALDDGRPVVMNFIYTTCTAICPVSSQVFMQLREMLGAERDQFNMASFSIDPEQDTPQRLAAYAKRFGAAGVWNHYTGRLEDCVAVQRAFDAWRGDKMNHTALTLMRSRPGKAWVRVDGFATPDQLMNECRGLLKA